jgi:hypothetical protein
MPTNKDLGVIKSIFDTLKLIYQTLNKLLMLLNFFTFITLVIIPGVKKVRPSHLILLLMEIKLL